MLREVVKQSASLPSNSKILIFGGGFSGQHIANAARQLGAEVLCSRRDPTTKGADFAFDSASKTVISDKHFHGVTHLISCVPPAQNGEDPVLKKCGHIIKNMPLKWAGYLSTTGVYGDYKGGWVTEESDVHPSQNRSIRRLACEQKWEALGVPLQILRLPGIYGPGRSALEAVVSQKNSMVYKPGQVFSRIHIDDIAGAIIHLINLFSKDICPRIINISDSLPATNIEVLSCAANLLDIPIPDIESFESASKNMSPMALSFWQENRKVSNHKLCNDLGYKLIHTDYRDGLKDCLMSNQSN